MKNMHQFTFKELVILYGMTSGDNILRSEVRKALVLILKGFNEPRIKEK